MDKQSQKNLIKAKTQDRKFETNIPRKGIALPQSQFQHSCVGERFIYSHHQSAYSAAGKYVDRSWEYINHSQTQECGNWDRGRVIPFLGIHYWDFRCSAHTFEKKHVTCLDIGKLFSKWREIVN
jgi:hypothetical protein